MGNGGNQSRLQWLQFNINPHFDYLPLVSIERYHYYNMVTISIHFY